MNYLDFELEIGPGTGREYPVAVIRSPAGEAREIMRFPFDELQLESRLKDLQIALLRAGGKRRLILSQEERAVQNLGQELFRALLTGEILSRYRVSLERAAGQGAGLRLKLRIAPPELAALPWEFLYDANHAEYICLSLDTPIIRYVELPRVIQPLAVSGPLRILGMIASPNDLPALDVERERQRVVEAVKGLQANGLVELTWLEGQTWQALQRALRRGPWHIFHFIGHGSFNRSRDEGEIALADEQGRSYRFGARLLGRLLDGHKSLRLALLNACEGARGSERDVFSSTAAILVQRGLPAVLAMQYEISDRAAIEFARSFYEAVADGYPVDAAVAEARKAITFAVANSLEWGTPVLYMRSADGVLFTVTDAPPSPPPPPASPVAAVKPSPEPPPPSDPAYLAWLRQQIAQLFSLEELRTLCADLDVLYDDLPGEGITGKARELVAYLERRGRLPELVTACLQMRPNVHWNEHTIRGGLIGDMNHFGEPEWIEIPAGEFWMGSEKGEDREKPLHRLYLDTFWIAKTPVTNAQYYLFVQATGHRLPDHWQNGSFPAGLEQHPVVYVSWDDAIAYCRWLSQVTGKQITLPSEAQWEKAARGAKDKREYPWGDTFDSQRANGEEAGIGTTTPVGRFPDGASPYGVLDMSGNVWEWTRTIWDAKFPYPYVAGDGRENLNGRGVRVLRGGSFYQSQMMLRCAYRFRLLPDLRLSFIGFRLIASPSAPLASVPSGL